MKFIISENKVNQVILNYLNDNVTPESPYHGPNIWGPSFHKQIRRDVEKHNSCTFTTADDEEFFTFYKRYGVTKNVLSIHLPLYNTLTSLFNDKWIPILKEWFEKNTGLEVSSIENDSL